MKGAMEEGKSKDCNLRSYINITSRWDDILSKTVSLWARLASSNRWELNSAVRKKKEKKTSFNMGEKNQAKLYSIC